MPNQNKSKVTIDADGTIHVDNGDRQQQPKSNDNSTNAKPSAHPSVKSEKPGSGCQETSEHRHRSQQLFPEHPASTAATFKKEHRQLPCHGTLCLFCRRHHWNVPLGFRTAFPAPRSGRHYRIHHRLDRMDVFTHQAPQAGRNLYFCFCLRHWSHRNTLWIVDRRISPRRGRCHRHPHHDCLCEPVKIIGGTLGIPEQTQGDHRCRRRYPR